MLAPPQSLWCEAFAAATAAAAAVAIAAAAAVVMPLADVAIAVELRVRRMTTSADELNGDSSGSTDVMMALELGRKP